MSQIFDNHLDNMFPEFDFGRIHSLYSFAIFSCYLANYYTRNKHYIGLDERKSVYRVCDKGLVLDQPARQQLLLATHNYFIKITEYLNFWIFI